MVEVIPSRSKDHGHAHLLLMSGPHTQFGYGNLNILATATFPKMFGWTDIDYFRAPNDGRKTMHIL